MCCTEAIVRGICCVICPSETFALPIGLALSSSINVLCNICIILQPSIQSLTYLKPTKYIMKQNNFEQGLSKLVNSLKLEIQKSDPIYLMSLLNQKLLHSIQPSDSPADLPDGFTQKFHYIYGLIVTQPLSRKRRVQNNSRPFDCILSTTENIFKEYINLWLTRSSLDGSKETKKVKEYGAGLVTFLGTLHQPKLGSSEQFLQFTLDRFEAFDDRFFLPKIGVATQQCIDVFSAILEKIRVQYESVIEGYTDAMKPMTDMWKQFRAGEITLEETRQRVKEEPIFKELDQRLKTNAFQFTESFVVSLEDFVADFPRPALEAFFSYFSCIPGSINKEFRYPTDFNELDVKPLIQIEPGRYYVPEAISLLRKLPTILERELLNSNLAQTYFKHRDRLTQKNTVKLLSRVFQGHSIIEEAYYGYKSTQEFETDVLVPHGRTLLICEIKAKALRNPLHTEGNIDKIKRDFEDSVQKAYEQALRTRDYVLSQETALFMNKKGHPLCDLQRDSFDDYLLLVVTAESFGSLTSDLSLLLEKEQDAPYPLAISQFDLELLLTRLNSPDKLFNYMRQRCQLHGSVFGSDELDFAGYYIRYGNLNFEAQLKKANMIILDGNLCRIFDEDWYEAHGFKTEKNNEELNSPYFSVIERHGNEVSIGVEGFPDTFETLNLDELATQKNSRPKMTGRNRNAPCPCGSGKKYKKCHGKPEWLL